VSNPFAPSRIDHYFVHASLTSQLHDFLID
jgi:hypothetical protein